MSGRLLLWLGPIAILLASVPSLPPGVRVGLAIAGVLLGVPAAAWPYWWPLPTGPGNILPGRSFALRVARAAAIVPLPFLLLAAVGMLGVPTSLLGRLLLTLQVLTVLASLFRLRTRPVAGVSGTGRAFPAGIAIIVVGLAALGAGVGAPIGAEDDALDHVATIRHLIESDRVEFPGAFYGVDVPAGTDPRKGVLHLALALAGNVARVPLPEFWTGSATVLAPLLGLGFLALAVSLFGTSPLVVLLAIPALLFIGGDSHWLLKGAYGGHAGLGFAWAALAGLLSGGGMLFAVAAGAGAAALHAYAPVQVAAPFAVYLALSLVRPVGGMDPVARGARSLGAFIAGALPVEVARLLLSPEGRNPLHEQAMAWLELGPGVVASPLQLLDWYGMAGMAAIPALLLAATVKGGRGRRYLLASLAAPLLLLANPWLFHPVALRLGSVANKLALAWCGALVALWIVQGIADRMTTPWRRLVLVAALALILAGLRPDVPFRWGGLTHRNAAAPWTFPPEVAALVADRTPPTAVLASDPLTAYAIPALSGRRAIVTLHQHAPPGDVRALERLAAANDLWSSCVPLDEALVGARREGATHLLVPPPATARIDPFGAHRDPRNNDALAARFAGPPTGLEPVGEAGGFRLFLLAGTPRAGAASGEAGSAEIGAGDDATVPGTPDAAADSGHTAASIPPHEPRPGGLLLEAAGLQLAVHSEALPESTARGGRLSLPVSWRRLAGGVATPAYGEVQVHLRVESSAIDSASSRGLFSKLRRRWIEEPRHGGLLRSRGVELPFRGLCPPGRWPAGEWLPDTLEVTVPQALISGFSRVRLSLEEVSLYPRLRPADLFSNEDRYAGPVLGQVKIE